MSKKVGIPVMILALLAICLSVISLTTSAANTKRIEKMSDADSQYVMYVGTNDKDTDEPVCTPEEAKERAAGSRP